MRFVICTFERMAIRTAHLFLCTVVVLCLHCGLFTPYDVSGEESGGAELGVLKIYVSDEAEEFFRTTPQVRESKEVIYLGTVVASYLGEIDTFTGTEINLHGEHALHYPRKSLEFDIGPKRPLFHHPDALDEFFILALSEDVGYVNYYIGASVLTAADLFHCHFEYIEVYLNDTYEGLYLFIEKTQNAVRNVFNDVAGVYRRDYNSRFWQRYCSPSYTDCTPFRTMCTHVYDIVDQYGGQARLDSLRQIMDFDKYCDWLAINTWLQNGDYVDEVFFVVRALGDSGSFRIDLAAWDYEELFLPPHGGKSIPNSLVYNGEDSIDVAIAADAVLYGVFKENFKSLLDSVAVPSLMSSIRDSLERIVLPQFTRAKVAETMDNFSSSPARAYSEMRNLIADRFSRAATRRDSILAVLQ